MFAKHNRLWAYGLFCAGLILAWPAAAEVVPVTILTGRGTGSPDGAPASYTVPAGKVLVVEGVQYRPPTGTTPTAINVMFNITPENFGTTQTVFVYVGEYERFKRYTFDPPMRLAAGDRLNSNATTGYYLWFGLLVDQADLFASLDVELQNPRVESGKLIADAKVSSPRPRRITAKTSDGLLDEGSFQPDPSATVARGSSTSHDVITVDLGESDRMFLRASAVARPK